MRRLACLLLSLVTSACVVDDGPLLPSRDAGADAPPPDTGPIDAGFTCEPDAPGCFGYVHYVCGADGHSRTDEELCEGGCDPATGCIECIPGSFRCDGDVSLRCDEDHRWLPVRDCSEWGVACGGSGLCDDACGLAEAVRSNVGCEYWPVPLANTTELERDAFDFRVVVANPSSAPADVTITRGPRLVARERVPPGGLTEIPLPWVDGVSFPIDPNDWESVTTADGAYRLISSRPVIVSQFNPFHYSRLARNSFSNDASLLLPSHVLGRDHVAASYVPISTVGTTFDGDRVYYRTPGYVAIVGTSSEPTNVEIVVGAHVAADSGGRWPATARGGTIRFTLARGEVAQVAAAVPPECGPERPVFHDYSPEPEIVAGACREDEYDLTGSRVTSDRPISVFGGHVCAYVPYDVGACDHLETTLAPVETWGRSYQTMPMRDPDTDVPNTLRIIAAHDGTDVAITPDVHLDDASLDAGEWIEVTFDHPVSITASRPIQVVQLSVGQNITDPPLERGDPSMTHLVPTEQFRRDYVFITPSSYTPVVNGQSYLVISREPDEPITLDGRTIEATWTTVGDREIATVPVSGGTHEVRAATPVGVMAYGLGLYTSYAYPAGLDLRVIPI
ncbi:IgGFc-binding protein [Sandaracinus amylolyticus]|uniref:IgGFc-binding protein n=1 Tax=Sandaracinus amylolyticus TaxID=927083 RepID=UPI001F194BFB|nr:IgGFc-binding protein [Sandaracinus amylolyticus]UJR82800.1 Hypothetical protein I5071_48650 [Sandaracinus amylolyticus]